MPKKEDTQLRVFLFWCCAACGRELNASGVMGTYMVNAETTLLDEGCLPIARIMKKAESLALPSYGCVIDQDAGYDNMLEDFRVGVRTLCADGILRAASHKDIG